MFQKKQYIYSETQGVCQVENIVRLRSQKGTEMSYYVLRPVFEAGKVSYIPVKGHQVELRELFTVEEAEILAKSEQVKKDYKLQDAVDFVLQNREEEKHATKRTGNQ